MADNSDTPAPAKAAPRKTMAPAARNPAGADDGTSREEFEASLERLSDREFDRLEEAVRAARRSRRRNPEPPSFGMSEGERQELEQRGEATSPWTGEQITGDGAPRGAAATGK